MSNNIYVIGHKNPDTDSICAAIAYANLKRIQGNNNVIACRAGELNAETRYVLDYFKVAEPVFLPDIHTRVKDLISGPVVTINPDVPLYEAWILMKNEGVKTLPVADDNMHLQGLITVGDLAEKYMDDSVQRDLASLHVRVQHVLKTLSGTLINGSADDELKGSLVIGAMHWETMSKTLLKGSVILMGNREKGQLAAIEAGASCLILTNGAGLTPSIEKEVIEKDVTVISVPMDTFSAARMILMSTPVKNIMRTENLVVFEDEDLIDEAKKVMLETRFRNYPVVDQQNRVIGSIARYHILGSSKKQVILVDHNELGQAVKGIEEAQIIEVVDHHRVGGIQTGEPILFRNEPVGSTCTLAAKSYFEQGVDLSPEIAGILCAAILSDTVIFKSPTCTQIDIDIAEKLAHIAGINAQEFGISMFKQSSSLSKMEPSQVIKTDLKEFAMGEITLGIGQVSAMGIEELPDIKQCLLNEMESIRKQDGFEFVLLMVTDLLSEATTLLISGQKPEKISEAFGIETTENQMFLPGVLSRKKQVVPPLMKYFS